MGFDNVLSLSEKNISIFFARTIAKQIFTPPTGLMRDQGLVGDSPKRCISFKTSFHNELIPYYLCGLLGQRATYSKIDNPPICTNGLNILSTTQ